MRKGNFMLFHSHLFVFLFLPLTLLGWYGLHYIKKEKTAQVFLIAMSLWFYAYLNIHYLWMLLGSCLVNWTLSALMQKKESVSTDAAGSVSDEVLAESGSAGTGRRLILVIGLLFHLGTLGYFKYTNFFLENINAVFFTDFAFIDVILPVGISFYAFQQIAFLVDRFRREEKHCSLLDYLTFMTYFPQLLQGPILLGKEFIPQLSDPARGKFDTERFCRGAERFVIGLAKKTLLADTLADFVNFGYGKVGFLDSPSAILLAVGYLFELYFDFSGYCDMAVGVGKMLGLKLPENFDSPFHAASVKEFWRRWHITLGRFFTRYVYIPLGGSRKGKCRTILNTMIIFALSGLWHGASWAFVLWGILHGIGVAFDSLQILKLPAKWMHQLLTFAYVCIAFVFFRAADIAEGFLLLKLAFTKGWTGFLWKMADAFEISELYIVEKLLSMKVPALLPWMNMCVTAAVFGISVIVLAQKNAGTYGSLKDGKQTPALTVRHGLWLAFLFAWSMISLTGVSEYIYFSF